MQLCLFSISYAGLWGQAAVDLHAFVRRTKSLGFDAVMLAGKRPHLSPLDANESYLEQLRDVLEQSDMRCAVVAAYTDFGGTVAAEVPYLEMQIVQVENLCRLARRLGASLVRVFTAYEQPHQSPQTTWRQTVNCLREICDRAAAWDVTIAIQNHHDIGLHTQALLELLADIGRPNARLGFDAWSPALRGEDLYRAALAAAPHTAITTNADYVRLPRYHYRPELVNYESVAPDLVRAVPFGTGFIDYAAFFSGLRDGGFDGVATYEMCSPIRGGGDLKNLDRYAAAYVTWMRRHVLGEGAAQAPA
ncbi:MAG: sugar phosphate isomerase/epimerase family protein [Pirellulaceae bacterium]